MKQINWKKTTHKDWVIITVDLLLFMEYFKANSPQWYVKRGNKNEVKGRIDRFKEFINSDNKNIICADFYFLIDKKTFKPELIIVNGRHRLAALLEDGYKTANICVPKNQQQLFTNFIIKK